MSWWIRPLVRLIAAVLLPFIVPAVIIGILWALPGDPASIICPPEICSLEGRDALAEHWNLHRGPTYFYTQWLSAAFGGDLGRSWRVMQGFPVNDMLGEYVPNTMWLIGLSFIPVILGSVAGGMGWVSRRLDSLWQGIGLVPAVIMALVFAAIVEINYGALSYEGWPMWLRLIFGGIVLGVADGMLANSVLGTRSVFEEETKQRYAQISILRGESVEANVLPNVLPSLVGQFRSRILHLLSGAVVVEVVLNIAGVGSLLWDGTLLQDFGVVLAAAWIFALFSGGLLFFQAMSEVGLAMYIRKSPVVPA